MSISMMTLDETFINTIWCTTLSWNNLLMVDCTTAYVNCTLITDPVQHPKLGTIIIII